MNKPVKVVIQNVLRQGKFYGFDTPYHHILKHDCGLMIGHETKQTVLLDYSSVNIAKPVHLGHLRATLTGQFIKRINEAMGHRVIGINYLGDWGTQFGVLALGYQKYGNKIDFDKDPMGHLFDVYVKATQQLSIDNTDKAIARDFVHKMENGDKEALELWQTFRMCSLEDLKQTYKRMGIRFSDFEFESEYAECTDDTIERLKLNHLLEKRQDGLSLVSLNEPHKQAAVLKSDGTSLYLTRDIAAAISRHERYNFHRIHYVVDIGQSNHFENLASVLSQLNYSWCQCPPWDFHVKFGRVEGMSTRKGTAVFLRDILNTARDEMIDRMHHTKTTRIMPGDPLEEETADILGQTLLVTELLHSSRTGPITFSWERNNTGLVMQYCYARLWSLEERCKESGYPELPLPNDLDDEDLLTGEIHEVFMLSMHLDEFERAVHSAYVHYEPRYILDYTIRLFTLINKCFKLLPVIKCKNAALAQSRLALFMASRQVLHNCFTILGIRPLKKL